MAELLCVTQRSLCPDDFLERVRRLAQAKPQAILLREKDLGEADYEVLAGKCRNAALLGVCAL